MPASVKVRCYGGLLGDCFLLRFPPKAGGGDDLSMLIDFGVLQNFPAGEARLAPIAADIRNETGGKLDIVVVTHRHWDHVCGFGKHTEYADDVGELWMSWIENPDDRDGRRITGNVAQTEARLAAFACQAGAAFGADGNLFPELAEIENALTFTASALGPAPAGGRLTTPGCIDALRDKVKGPSRYFKPGTKIAIPGSDVVVWVLGPPTDEKLLADQEPSADKHEVYKLTAGMLGEAPEDAVDGAIQPPFDPARGLAFPAQPQENALAANWLAKHYDAEAWRRVDGIGMEALALTFDNIVNNTSLVLAFELPSGGSSPGGDSPGATSPSGGSPRGDVLLFAADAQVGNWQSWHTIEWPDKADPAAFIDDLLGRVVFYKVGHHGSINATASVEGLDRMTSPKLRAFIPVVEDFARSKKPKAWDMPHESMRRALDKRTAGRIARGDAPLPAAFSGNPGAFPTPVFTAADPANLAMPFHIDFEF